MLDATNLARAGAPHGSVVVSERQTAGVGRHGHSWHSASQGGLYCSIVLRLANPGPSLTLALGLAVQRAVDETAQVATDLRWPNDAILNGRKLAGILVQTGVQGEDSALIAGIGVNVNQASFPEELREIATSLRIETGREWPKRELLDRIVAESLRHATLPKAEILRRFEERSTYARGKRVVVDERTEGVTEGLDPDGFLLLRTANGLETITAGGVRPLGEE